MLRRPRLRNMRLAWAVLAAQIATGLLVAAISGVAGGPQPAMAALFGALVAAVPGLWMAFWLLPRRRAASTSTLARGLYIGELGKIGLTVGLFFAAALLFGQHLFVVLVGYVACLACYWLALILTR